MNDSAKRIENILPLSPMQQGMLFHALADGGSDAYFQQIAYRVRGALDQAAFEAAWNELFRRHPVLRTMFVDNDAGPPLQVVLKDRRIDCAFQDLRHLGSALQAEAIAEHEREDRRRAFDLRRDVLMRVTVLRLQEDLHEIVWSHHHILLDGWSLMTLQREFKVIYDDLKQGRPPGLRPAPPFSRYVKWLQTRDLEAAAGFWNAYLAGYDRAAGIPMRARVGDQAERAAERGRHAFHLDASLTASIQRVAADCGVTQASLLAGVWAILLARYSGRDDVVFGIVVSGRPPELAGVEDMVGLFVNTIPLRVQPHSNLSFRQLLREVQDDVGRCERHQYLPLARIQAESSLGNRLIGTHLTVENYPIEGLAEETGGSATSRWQIEQAQIEERTHYAFDVQFVPVGRGIRVQMAYDRAQYDDSQVARVEGHLRAVLGCVLHDPETRLGAIDVTDAGERRLVLRQPVSAARPSGRTLVDWLEAAVAAYGDRVAASCEGRTLTYGELNARADDLAADLVARGVGPEARVVLYLDRSLDMLVAIVATLKAGGAYVPIDLAYPAERIRFMIADCRGALLLTQGALASQLPEIDVEVVRIDVPDDRAAAGTGERARPRLPRPHPDQLAYVIYTSGSTGTPKGAGITHRNVVRLFEQSEPWLAFDASDVWTMFHSYAFDFSVWEIWGALLYGGRLVVVPYWLSRSTDEFHRLLREEGVTVLNQTPSAFRQLIEADRRAGSERAPPLGLALRLVIFGGEALDLQGLAPWLDRYGDRSPQLVNMYGITETTVHVTYRPLDAQTLSYRGSVIGEPIPDLRFYVLDERFRPVPLGAPGEIHVGGGGLARGYLDRPGLTAERFVPDPFAAEPGARLYRTGDLGRVVDGGEVLYLGRKDQQVKLRGFRIELGEIEAALKAEAGVGDAAVKLYADEEGGGSLAAYLVIRDGSEAPAANLRERLAARLPQYMMPTDFVVLDQLPLTVNGKLDRAALPAPARARGGEECYAPPRNRIEDVMAQVWAEVTKRDRVGIHDNYFALGGDSIKAIQTAARLRREGLQVAIRDLFRYPTIAELSAHVTIAAVQRGAVSAAGPVPLTPIQRHFFSRERIEPNRFNYAALLRAADRLDAGAVAQAAVAILRHHDALRATFVCSDGTWQQEIGELPHAAGQESVLEITDVSSSGDPLVAVAEQADRIQGSLDLAAGPLMKLAIFRGAEADRLLIVVHHLVVDAVSWRILLEDLGRGYAQARRGEDIELPAKTEPYQAWAMALEANCRSPALREEAAYWKQVEAACEPVLVPAADWPTDRYAEAHEVSFRLDREQTERLLQDANRTYSTTAEDLLLAALIQAIHEQTAADRIALLLEGHGRDHPAAAMDVSRTVGWFTSLYPVVFSCHAGRDLGYRIKATKETIRRVPNHGVGYGILKYMTDDAAAPLDSRERPQLSFNYLGRFEAGPDGDRNRDRAGLELADEPLGAAVNPAEQRPHEIDISALVLRQELEVRMAYNRNRFGQETMDRLLGRIRGHLLEILDHCTGRATSEVTPTDLTYSDLTLDELEGLFS